MDLGSKLLVLGSLIQFDASQVLIRGLSSIPPKCNLIPARRTTSEAEAFAKMAKDRENIPPFDQPKPVERVSDSLLASVPIEDVLSFVRMLARNPMMSTTNSKIQKDVAGELRERHAQCVQVKFVEKQRPPNDPVQDTSEQLFFAWVTYILHCTKDGMLSML